MKPIKPSEVPAKKNELIPDFVIESFNELIVKKWDHNTKMSIVDQNDIITNILEKQPHLNRHEIFINKWLDVEDIYVTEGWSVEYVKPAYFEDFTAHLFLKKVIKIIK